MDFALFWGRLIKRLVPVAYLIWPMLVAAAALVARRAGIAFRQVTQVDHSGDVNRTGGTQYSLH